MPSHSVFEGTEQLVQSRIRHGVSRQRLNRAALACVFAPPRLRTRDRREDGRHALRSTRPETQWPGVNGINIHPMAYPTRSTQVRHVRTSARSVGAKADTLAIKKTTCQELQGTGAQRVTVQRRKLHHTLSMAPTRSIVDLHIEFEKV